MLFLLALLPLTLCNLNIISPTELKEEFPKGLEYNIGNFGHTPYGFTLYGQAVLANPVDACTPLVYDQKGFPNSFFLVVRRGGCPFVTKANYAQINGAKMIIIVDSQDESIDNIIMQNSLFRVDNGHAVKLNIPSIILEKSKGEKLIQELQNGVVNLSVKFEQNQSNEVKVIFWLNVLDSQSYEMLFDYSQFSTKMDRLKFEPKYFMINGDYLSSDMQEQLCIGGGKYCLPNFEKEHERESQVKLSSQRIMEILDQLCIYKEDPKNYFKYMLHYKLACTYQDKDDQETCSQQIMKTLEIDHKKINTCVLLSYGLGSDEKITEETTKKSNIILQNNIDDIIKYQVHYFPAVFIDSKEYRGNLDHDGIVEAICSAYLTSPPAICKFYLTGVEGGHEEDSESGLFTFIFLVVLSFGVAFFLYQRNARKKMQEEMGSQVNTMVSQYIAFYEKKEGDAKP